MNFLIDRCALLQRTGLICILAFLSGSDVYADEYEDARAKLEKKYGVAPKRMLSFADEDRDQPLVQLFERHSASVGLSPSYAYTVAMLEGLFPWCTNSANRADGVPRLDKPIDGYDVLGADHFATDLPRIRQFRLIRADYAAGKDFSVAITTNEQGTKVEYAVYRSMSTALEGFCANLALRKKLLDRDLADLKLAPLDEDKRHYWIYAYYIDGEGDARHDLEKTKGDFSQSTRTRIKNEAILRLSTWRYVLRFARFKS